jgi:hypothetical protein
VSRLDILNFKKQRLEQLGWESVYDEEMGIFVYKYAHFVLTETKAYRMSSVLLKALVLHELGYMCDFNLLQILKVEATLNTLTLFELQELRDTIHWRTHWNFSEKHIGVVKT